MKVGHMRGRRTDVTALRDLMLKGDFSQIDLARASGVSYSFIRAVLAGDRQFSDRTARKVATALGCNLGDFSAVDPSRETAA